MPITHPSPRRLAPQQLSDRQAEGAFSVIDLREPTDLPEGPLVLVCQSGKRSSKGLAELLRQGQVAAGSLVLLGVVLSLAVMPWHRVAA